MENGIVKLYNVLRADDRLQKDWEKNQSRNDRCLEAPLIVMTPREVATAALISIKMRFEPGIQNLAPPELDESLLEWAYTNREDLCKGGPRLVKVIQNPDASQEEKSAAVVSLSYYRDRNAENSHIKYPWSQQGLQALAHSIPEEVQSPHLKVTSKNAALGVIGVASMLVNPPNPITRPLPKLPGVGHERSDAIGVFGFSQGWPITDEALWQLCIRHNVFTEEDKNAKGYKKRNKYFMKHWKALLVAFPSADPGDIAANLYLWANEAHRYGHQYWS